MCLALITLPFKIRVLRSLQDNQLTMVPHQLANATEMTILWVGFYCFTLKFSPSSRKLDGNKITSVGPSILRNGLMSSKTQPSLYVLVFIDTSSLWCYITCSSMSNNPFSCSALKNGQEFICDCSQFAIDLVSTKFFFAVNLTLYSKKFKLEHKRRR